MNSLFTPALTFHCTANLVNKKPINSFVHARNRKGVLFKLPNKCIVIQRFNQTFLDGLQLSEAETQNIIFWLPTKTNFVGIFQKE